MRIFLWLVFYFIVTPFAILFRLLGIKMLDLNLNKSQYTYWNLVNKQNDYKRN